MRSQARPPAMGRAPALDRMILGGQEQHCSFDGYIIGGRRLRSAPYLLYASCMLSEGVHIVAQIKRW